MIHTFEYFLFRLPIRFFLFNSFLGLALLSSCEPILLFVRAYRVSESVRLYISSWSVHRLNLCSVVYEFLTRDVTSFSFVPTSSTVRKNNIGLPSCPRCLSTADGGMVSARFQLNPCFSHELVKAGERVGIPAA